MTKPWAAPTIYTDGRSLFLEWPAALDRPAHAMRFLLSEGGLAKALRHIPNITSAPGYVTGGSNLLAKPKPPKVRVAKTTTARREVVNAPEALRDAIGAAIRKLKVGQ